MEAGTPRDKAVSIMKTLIVAMFSLTLVSTTACGKKSDGDKAKPTEGGGKAGGGGAPAVKMEYKKVGNLGIEMEVPSDANIDDNSAGAGAPSATIWATPTTFVSGDSGPDDLDSVSDTFEDAKAAAQKDAGKFGAFTKEEKTEGGWHLEWDADSITGSKVFGISIHTTIDGKPWECGTNAGSKEEREKVVQMCKSLRKAS